MLKNSIAQKIATIYKEIKKMAKKGFNPNFIASAMASQIHVEDTAPAAEEKKVEEVAAEPAIEAAPVAPVEAAPKKKVGRPRKEDAPDPSDTKMVRARVSSNLKKKLGFICAYKGCSEQDLILEALEKVIEREYAKITF